MAEVRNLYVVLSANATAFRGQMVAAGSSVRGLGQDVVKVGNENEKFRKSLGNIGLVAGGAMVAGIGYGLIATVKLEKAMRNVSTISDEVANHLDYYTGKIVEMGAELPQTSQQLAEGFYDIVSSGYDGADALEILHVSAMSASAGLTDTAVAAKATLTVLNAYGLGAAEAGDVSDILFQTVNKGIMSYEELAGSIGSVVPTAAAAKIAFDDTAAALAAITLSGITADEASTALNQTIAKILVPSKDMTNALEDIGYETGAAALEAEGLHGVITKLAESQGHAADTAFRLFPEIRAAKGYMALTTAEGKNYAATFDSIADTVERAEAAQRAYTTQSQSDAAAIDRIQGNLESLAVSAGQVFEPALRAVLFFTESLTDMLGSIPGPVKDVVTVLAGIGGVGLIVSGGFLKAYDSIQSFRTGLTTLTGASRTATVALKGLQISLGIIGIALVAATAIYGAYTSHKRDAKEATDDFVGALKREQEGVKDAALSELVKKMVDSGAIDDMKNAGIDYGKVMAGITGDTQAWTAAQGEFDTAIENAMPGYAELNTQLVDLKARFEEAPSLELSDAIRDTEYRMYGLRQQNQGAIDEIENLRTETIGYHDALDDARGIIDATAKAEEKAARASLVHADALVKLEQRLAPVKDGEQQLDAVTKALQETLGGMSSPMTAFQSAMKEGEVSLDDFVDAMARQVRDMHNYMDNIARLAARGREDLAAEFIQMGPEAAGLVRQAVNASDKELDRLSRTFNAQATMSTIAFRQGLRALPAIAKDTGDLTVQQLADAFTGGAADEAVAMLKVLGNSIKSIPLRHKIQMILLGDEPARKRIERIADRYNKLPKELRTEVAADGIPKSLAEIKKIQEEYDLTPEEVETLLKARDLASVVIDKVNGKARAMTDGEIAILAADRASAVIDGVKRRMWDLDGTISTVYINASRSEHMSNRLDENARGGIYNGGVRAFADGGWGQDGRYYSRTPQIVRGGTNILWGEQSTGFEAYISGKPSERSRNVDILGRTASRFGYDLAPRGRESVSSGQRTVIVRQEAPMIGTLSVPAQADRHAARETIRDVVYAMRDAQRGGKWGGEDA